MEGKRFIQSLKLQNFLSYSGLGEEIKLEPLNVLIGPNASGKSNLIEAIGLLRSLPKDFAAAIREGGGINEWLWKGKDFQPIARIEITVNYAEAEKVPLRYLLHFTRVEQRMEILEETLRNVFPVNQDEEEVFYLNEMGQSAPYMSFRIPGEDGISSRKIVTLNRKDLNIQQSILSEFKSSENFPEITYLGNSFSAFQIYREWNLNRSTSPRIPANTDLPANFLMGNASNLALVLNNMNFRARKQILEYLKKFYNAVEDVSVKIQGGTAQLFIQEKGLDEAIPATRLSDGTLRYLCLLSVLCHPEPPPLICIEEPELGLHPDILPTVAELMIEASKRTQLIVTTHSDTLVSALSDVPETVLICERDENGTHTRRLQPDQLKEWLKKYSLGELWRMGEIGGTLW